MDLPNELEIIINNKDQEKDQDKYYIYGINQNYNNNRNIGIISILANLSNLTLIEYIKTVILFLEIVVNSQ